jgi:hypothetical protein
VGRLLPTDSVTAAGAGTDINPDGIVGIDDLLPQ